MGNSIGISSFNSSDELSILPRYINEERSVLVNSTSFLMAWLIAHFSYCQSIGGECKILPFEKQGPVVNEVRHFEGPEPNHGDVVVSSVVVDHHNRSIMVGFRGTCGFKQLWHQIKMSRIMIPFEDGKVLKYCVDAFKTLWEEEGNKQMMRTTLIHLRKKYPDYVFKISGHSFGGGLGQLCALAMAKDEKLNQHLNQELISFGMPPIGDENHSEEVNWLETKNQRIYNVFDPVPNLSLLFHFIFGLKHAGIKKPQQDLPSTIGILMILILLLLMAGLMTNSTWSFTFLFLLMAIIFLLAVGWYKHVHYFGKRLGTSCQQQRAELNDTLV